jgi:Zn ribbon nucleic-acid-binding protein
MKTTVQCGACKRASTIDAWRSRPATARLTAGDLQGYVVGWPAGEVVEVRPCEGCGRAMARRIPRETAA